MKSYKLFPWISLSLGMIAFFLLGWKIFIGVVLLIAASVLDDSYRECRNLDRVLDKLRDKDDH